jgi:hypothetical protein
VILHEADSYREDGVLSSNDPMYIHFIIYKRDDYLQLKGYQRIIFKLCASLLSPRPCEMTMLNILLPRGALQSSPIL